MFSGGKEPQNPKSLKLSPSPEITPDVFRYTFKLTRENIQMLRERLIRESSSSFSSSKELRLSTFVIVFSYVFVCLIKARAGELNRPVGYVFSVDCRSFMNPPIPKYFGNCISGYHRMMLKAEMFMGQERFSVVARMISDSIEKWDENDAWKIQDFVAYSTLPPETQFIVASGSTRFGVYGLDFGWGRPDKVVIATIGQGNGISMADSRDGNGGVEVGFSLKKHEMDALIDLLHHGLKI
ncbi:Phenolic glucoside malonyltransferase 1 [Cardamine amara subsp. amara]|uniref:Phenolic glucoside malonyltransferase 1 n=1 Tax=Cardamine amara subsp. amara TaxID=228776 RepID=A0ABD1A7K2_CARAN